MMLTNLNLEKKLFEKYAKCKKYLFSKEVYNSTIEDLKLDLQVSSSKSRHDYYIHVLNKYEVLQYKDVEKLIKKCSSPEDPQIYYVCIEETYATIQWAHITTGHDPMLKHFSTKYANVTRKCLDLFKSYCVPCQKPKELPILSQDFGYCSQVDLIDMQSSTHSQYQWIMVYQCQLSSVYHVHLHQRAAEVAFQLLDIFLMFSAPCILQSDNGTEFTAEVS